MPQSHLSILPDPLLPPNMHKDAQKETLTSFTTSD